MTKTIDFPTAYVWRDREFGPGEHEFDLSHEEDAAAYEALARVVESARHDPAPSPVRRRKSRPVAAGDGEARVVAPAESEEAQ